MVISHQHHFVFLHLPKTAGTSIEVALGLRYGRTGGWDPNSCEIVGETKHHVVPAAIPQDYTVFTFVRNPWDRILSYYMFRREPRNAKRRNIHPDERRISFRDWLLRLDEFRRYRRINAAFTIAVDNQSRIIGDLPQFVGRFENLTEDLNIICERVGVEPTALSNVNPTVHKTEAYAYYYTDETRDIVARLYREDIDRFGYEF
ncbi:MAG: sulfotransferase [Gammaproteobacteria bacterium]|nr:MAG: sulfotransferase [Gammaproteobacteria bacterium]